MKIGILTFHRAKNYGAMLQCYALSSFLKSLGFEVRVLDYNPKYLAGAEDAGFIWSIKKYIRFAVYCMLSNGEVKHADAFTSFVEKQIDVVPLAESGKMDAVVCGSDQIWSTKICGRLDPIFFGNVGGVDGLKKVSYAASNGNVRLSKDQLGEFKSLLQGMDAISVREKTLQENLTNLGVASTLVLDPVLLAGKDMFEPILCPVRQKKPYVLIYELTHLEATWLLAHKIAKTLHAEVLVMGGGMKCYLKKGCVNKQGLSPAQFVSYFKHAACVVTTSFHGTAFSVVYERPFYCMRMNSDKDDRILSLLAELDIMDRSVKDVDDISYSLVDYGKVRPKLETLRQQSKEFLLHALS